MKQNERVSAFCSVSSGKSPFEFNWLKNNHPFTGHTDVKIASTEDGSMITFRNVHDADSGNYSCLVRNSAGSASFTSFLSVRCESVLFHKKLNWTRLLNKLLRVGFPNLLTLKFLKEVQSTLFVRWRVITNRQSPWRSLRVVSSIPKRSLLIMIYKTGSSNKWITIKSESEKNILRIPQVSKEDEGSYSCVANNGFSDPGISTDFRIFIKGMNAWNSRFLFHGR